jgi:hypothetical protein
MFLIFTLSYLTGLYSGVIQYTVNIYLELKRTIMVITNSGIRDCCQVLFKQQATVRYCLNNRLLSGIVLKTAHSASLFSVHLFLTHVCS